jgi:two-component system sensor histidine kinase PilS (NtrC family)
MSAAALPESLGTQTSLASSPDAGEFAWRVLRLLNLFRLIIATVLLLTFLLVDDPRIVGEIDPLLAATALAALFTLGIIEIPLLNGGWPSSNVQTYFQFAFDVAAITALTHASGGISSGLGGLLVVTVGSLALLVSAERALLLAAVTTLVLLAEQSFALIQGMTTTAEFAPAGILGAVIFVITGVVQLLRDRIVQTEALAEQRGVDLQNLVELNDYIIQHLRESIVVVDSSDCIRLINESAGKLLGAPAAADGLALTSISPALAKYLQRWRERVEDKAPIKIGIASDDAVQNIQPHFARLGSGRSDGVVIFLEDTSLISERVQQTKLAALGRLSASIAHEIRNPLGALSHAGQLLAESSSMGPEDHRLTDIIRVNSRRVSQIVDSVLALSRSDKIQPESIPVKRWSADFVAEFVNTQELYEGALSLESRSVDFDVEMDRTHLHQIMWNLCDNAVKYASKTAGAIAVDVSCGYLEASGRPFLEVADRGPGVDPEMIDQIFEPFYTGQPGGTGLGLYISRELCERNGATLRYHPRPDGGSVFRIVFIDPQRWQVSN